MSRIERGQSLTALAPSHPLHLPDRARSVRTRTLTNANLASISWVRASLPGAVATSSALSADSSARSSSPQPSSASAR